MLREIAFEEIPEKGSFGNEITPNGAFAEDTVLDFDSSELMIAEVYGWPSGEPTNCKETSKLRQLLENKVKKHKLNDISVFQRGKRIFIQKTIVRKV